MTSDVTRGHEAHAPRDWAAAYAALAEARDRGTLGPDGFEELAVAAQLSGHEADSHDARDRAHRAWLDAGAPDRAARCVALLGLDLLLTGEPARASGWFQRGRRLVDDGPECAAHGYLLVPEAIEALARDDAAEAGDLYRQVVDIAERCDDRDLIALGLMGQGETAVHLGDTRRGLALLDEAMVSVTTGEVSEPMAGLLYCAVLEVCMAVLDLRRGSEWTDAFTRWCDESGAVPYRGQCLVHRSQLLQAHGRWVDALSEATQAEAWLAELDDPSVGVARYQQGEVHRLRGEVEAAETAYRRAAELGHEPSPGLALLRLAEGRVADAAATVRRMLDEAEGIPARVAVLAAVVEIALAGDDLDAASAARDELIELTGGSDAPYLAAVACHATGAVGLAADDPAGALATLRRAERAWRDLDMPHERARTQSLIAQACAAAGDHEAAARAATTARRSFERLGAVVDLAALDRAPLADDAVTTASAPAGAVRLLSDRECEVLQLVAQGRTNREIGDELVISEHTVARHLQNIFAKTDTGSRAAATAYAYEHGLV